MIDLVEDAPLHTYQNRIDDTKGNAKDSYVLDLRKMDRKFEKVSKQAWDLLVG